MQYVPRPFHTPVFVVLLMLFPSFRSARTPSPPAVAAPAALRATALSAPSAIVIGFVGGFVRRTNAIHYEVQLAQRLNGGSPSGLFARVFENRCGREARQEILRLLDTDKDGVLSPAERQRARIAIYGHSWGASQAITLARSLGHDEVPVLLTVQVDSVQKPGQDDASIPSNVSEAVNFYQLDGILHGRSRIYAADSSRTQILGNFRVDYKAKSIPCVGYPWFARVFMKPHVEIESDPAVWQQVESLIRSRLQPIPHGG